MIKAHESERWLMANPGAVIRHRLAVWTEKKSESSKPYYYAKLGNDRFYLGCRPELRDRLLALASGIRVRHLGADVPLSKMLAAWNKARAGRPSWKKLRNQILQERGMYWKGGRIRRTRAKKPQSNKEAPCATSK